MQETRQFQVPAILVDHFRWSSCTCKTAGRWRRHTQFPGARFTAAFGWHFPLPELLFKALLQRSRFERTRWKSSGRDARPVRSIHSARNSRIAAAIGSACVSSAKWPVSKKRTSASGISRWNASAPAGRKKGSFRPQTARNRGRCLRK